MEPEMSRKVWSFFVRELLTACIQEMQPDSSLEEE